MKKRYLTVLSVLTVSSLALSFGSFTLAASGREKSPESRGEKAREEARESANFNRLAARFGMNLSCSTLPATKSFNPSVRTLDGLEAFYGLLEMKAEEHERAVKAENSKKGIKETASANGVEEEGNGLDAMGAYLYWFRQRAYPGNSINFDAYAKAAAQRDSMGRSTRAANINPRGGIGVQSVTAGWQYIGPNNYSSYNGPNTGRINAIAYDPITPTTFFIGSSSGGVWKTSDNGVTFTPLSDQWKFMNTSCIAIDPTNTNTIYVGTGDLPYTGGYGFGLMKSTDGGLTFNNVGTAQLGAFAINRVVVDPETPAIITVATNSQLWRSVNGGTTFATVKDASNNPLPVTTWQGLEYGVKDGAGKRFLYAAGQYTAPTAAEVWRSADRGVTWKSITPPLLDPTQAAIGVSLTVSPTNKDAVYTAFYLVKGTTFFEFLYKSADAGNTWTDITNGLDKSANWSQGWYDLFLNIGNYYDPNNFNLPRDIPFLGLIDVIQSPDEGINWPSLGFVYQAGAKVHPDQHAMAQNPSNPSEALLGDDGGLYRVNWSLGTATFTPLSVPIGVTEIYRISVNVNNPDQVMAGLQDNSSPNSFGTLPNWSNVFSGDGGYNTIHPIDPNVQTASAQGGASVPIVRTTDNWATSTYIGFAIGTDNVQFIPPHMVDPTNTNILYAGTNYLYRWDSGTWTRRLGNTPGTPPGTKLSKGGSILSMAIAPSDNTRIYTGSDDAEIWMTTDAGASFTKIMDGKSTPAGPNRAITGINVNPNNPSDVTITVASSGTGHVWRCANTRSLTPLWVNLSGTGVNALPNIHTSTVARDPFDPDNALYVGTDVGVFSTNNFTTAGPGGPTWVNATNPLGLPNVRVSHLEAIYSKKAGMAYLFAGTFGRGIWRIHLTPPALQLASFTITPSTVDEGVPATATLKLTGPAPAGGINVSLSSVSVPASPNPINLPGTINVPQFLDNVSFPITTNTIPANAAVTVTATYLASVQTASMNVTSSQLQGVQFTSSNPVSAGQIATELVTMDRNVASDLALTVVSSNPAVASVPAAVSVLAGTKTISFPIQTYFIANDTNVNITVSVRGKSFTLVLKVKAIKILGLTLNPTQVVGGTNSTGTVTLSGPAIGTGALIPTGSLTPSLANSPDYIIIPAGSTTGTFTITTQPVAVTTTVIISTSYNGVSVNQPLILTPATIANAMKISPNPAQANSFAIATISLNTPAPAGGFFVPLSSSNTAAATVPVNLYFPAGFTTKSVTITTLDVVVDTSVTITANVQGALQAGTFTVTANIVSGITFTPSTVKGLQSAVLQLQTNCPAPAGGAVITLVSSNPSVLAVPATVIIPAGSYSKSFTYKTNGVVNSTNVTVTATLHGKSRSTTITVSP